MVRKTAPIGSRLKRPLRRPYIAEWRDTKHWTQERLAAAVAELMDTSFSIATLSRIENGKSPYNQRQLEAIAEAIGCQPADLIMRDPSKKDAPWALSMEIESLPEEKRKAIFVVLDSMKKAM